MLTTFQAIMEARDDETARATSPDKEIQIDCSLASVANHDGQATTEQVRHHQESQINQERMAERAHQLGWRADQVRLITEDLGKSGSSSHQRSGFRNLLSDISLGKVGIVFCYEMSRLARNSRDWHHLLEAAGLFDTLIADYDGIYDLHQFNDRLLLGLKGTMSEAELHLLKLRMAAGRKR